MDLSIDTLPLILLACAYALSRYLSRREVRS